MSMGSSSAPSNVALGIFAAAMDPKRGGESVPPPGPSLELPLPQPPARAPGHASPTPALLLMEGSHVASALYASFPRATEVEGGALVAGLIEAMEEAYGVSFVDRVVHEATPSGQPSALFSSLPPAVGVTLKTRALQPVRSTPVDPDTLEPLRGRPVTTMADAGVAVALSVDLLRHLGPQKSPAYSALVLVTDKANDLSEAIDLARGSCRVWICTTKDLAAPPATTRGRRCSRTTQGKTHRRDNSSSSSATAADDDRSALTLDDLLLTAAEMYVARNGDKGDGPDSHALRQRCEMGRRCGQVEDQAHARDFLHPCPQWQDCQETRWPRRTGTPGSGGGSGSSSSGDRVVCRGQLEHMRQFVHPCGLAEMCRNHGAYHRMVWYHPDPTRRPHCREGAQCQRIRQGPQLDEKHVGSHVHPCPDGEACQHLRGLQASIAEQYHHLTHFQHPCSKDSNCDK
jgi:hypothetical protein